MTEATLNLVDLDQPRRGYREFLSCWVYQSEAVSFVVDPGPKSSIDHLLDMLADLGIKGLDFVLLTHIHLDHGGGSRQILDVFPEARLYCHQSGVKHMVDPAKLWQGSLGVLGDVAEMYGEPSPIPSERLVDEAVLAEHDIKVIPTPGHASHHVSFLCGDVLFAGEAIGTQIELPGRMPYLRPSTPPRFMLDVALNSLDTLLALDPEPKYCAFAHYGMTPETFVWCRRAKKQLVIWVETLRELRAESTDNLKERFYDKLQEIDPLYGRGRQAELEADIRHREREFLGGTMAGMLGYLDSIE